MTFTLASIWMPDGATMKLVAPELILIATIIAASGVVLTAGYILWMIQRVYLGKPRPEYAGFPDANAREIAILSPMAVLVLALGILPKQTVLDFITGSLNNILALSGG